MDESANTPEHVRPAGDPGDSDPGPTVAARLGAVGAEREIEDDGPEPHLDADLAARVTALLAEVPDPGPMPDDVSTRIEAALLDAARLRVDPGPLAAGGGDPSDPSGIGHPGHTGATVLGMPVRAERPKPLHIVAAVAAAAAVVAVGASALHVTKRPNGAAIVGDTTSSTSGTTTPTPAPSTGGGLHIQLSTTAYDADHLATQARRLLDSPGAPIRDLAAEAPSIGPIATAIGLESCLEAIGALDASSTAPEAVSADLATFDGRPAVVVVVTRGGASTAWAVERSCTTGSPGVLQSATRVP